MGGTYLNEQSVLKGSGFGSQLLQMMQVMKNDNEAYKIAKTKLLEFCNNEVLTGKAVEGLQQQIIDYCSILDALVSANDSDIADFALMYVTSFAWGEILGWKVILGENQALSDEQFDLDMAAYWDNASRQAEDWELVYEWLCSNKANTYRRYAADDREIYRAWNEKREKYDNIYESTMNREFASKNIRDIAIAALSSIGEAFNGESYDTTVNDVWRDKLQDAYIDRVISVDANGDVTIDWNEVSKIQAKDAEDISYSEYEALMIVYLNAKPEELNRFFGGFMTKKEDVSYSWYERLSNSINEDYTLWEMDVDKVNYLLTVMSYEQEMYLLVENALKENGYNVEANSLEENRQLLMQRLILLGELGTQGEFRTEHGGSELDAVQVTEENGALTAKFKEFRTEVCGVDAITSNLGDSSITVGDPLISTAIDVEQMKMSEQAMLARFGVPSAGEIAGDTAKFAGLETLDVGTDKAVEKAVKYVSTDLGKKGLSKAIGCIPILGDIVSFGIETGLDYQEAQENTEFIEQEFNLLENAKIYSDYGCCACYVTYDTGDNKGTTISPFVGENTDRIIADINEHYGYDYTRADILGNTNQVYNMMDKDGVFDHPKYPSILAGEEVN